MKTISENLQFEAMQLKAHQNGFEIQRFTGFALIEIETGCDLYFENLNDINSYIDACDLVDTELKNRTKPTWNDAPEWANWLALDKNGSWYFFEFEPEPMTNATAEFCSTLEKRPNDQNHFEQRRAEIEQKINQGARLTNHRMKIE